MAGLTTYRSKRDFTRTSEPRGKQSRRSGYSFVVQKHAARRLHYDFRLELDGVLLSWAIPKGPSLDPKVKRLAVQTEDHPIEYGGFEGIIPEGEYGAGPVLVWDRGHWTPDGDPHASYEKGHLAFELEGEKLHGHWHLVRTRGDSKRPNWLLIKGKDSSAHSGPGSQIVDTQPQSALSGRTIDAVADAPKRVWHSTPARKTRAARSGPQKRATRKALPDVTRIEGARKATLPQFVEPQLATLVDQAPEGDYWLHEIKLDGYRMQLHFEDGNLRLLTRRGHDWSERAPALHAELAALPLQSALLDGELVVLHEGISSFQRLQNSLSEGGDHECTYFAFDLLHLGDRDLRPLPLLQRKQLLAATLQALGMPSGGRIRCSEHVIGSGAAFFASACKLGLEGSICKRADTPYVSGRGRS